MKRQMPSLDAIEAFLKAARTASFRDAADELAISPSAFSRKIQALEHFLGKPVFERGGSRPVLTPQGRDYLAAVTPAVEALRRASAPPGATRTLRVMAPHSFTIGWLTERLPRFLSAAGEAEVEIVIGRELLPLQMGSADVAIMSGPRDWAGLPCEPLAPLAGFPVSAPLLLDGRAAPASLGDLGAYPLLATTWPPDLWERWFAGSGHPARTRGKPVLYDTASLLYEAAAAGFGIALGTSFLADRLLASGRLQRIGSGSVPLGIGYFLVFASDRVRRRPLVRDFSSWMRASARDAVASA